MAHPQTAEAVAVPETQGDDGAVAALMNILNDEDQDAPDGDEPDADDGEGEAQEGEDAETDEQDDGEPDEAIPAPASLNADEKAIFAQLPPEAQRVWAASENRRNSQVQEATTKAANAQRVAEQQAAEAGSKAKAVFANQLAVLADYFAPQAPDPELARINPAEYLAQEAQYRALNAQHSELVQQVAAIAHEADQEIDGAFIAQRDRELLAIPEVANAETRNQFFDRVFEVAADLGYDRDVLLGNGNAVDFKALATAHGWKEKAAKYDALMAKQMQRVRSAKPTATPGTAQPKGSGQARALRDSTARLRQTGSVDDAAAALLNIL